VHRTGDLLPVQLKKATHVGAAERVGDEQVRRRDAGRPQQVMQLRRDGVRGARQRHPAAGAGAAAVVQHRRRVLGDPLVHVEVVQADGARAGEEHDGRSAGTGLVQPYLASGDFIRLSNWGIHTSIVEP